MNLHFAYRSSEYSRQFPDNPLAEVEQNQMQTRYDKISTICVTLKHATAIRRYDGVQLLHVI